mgnify:CR=1 FL=1
MATRPGCPVECAPGHGLAPDATLTTAPGGTFPASEMGCTSCHDPHGTEDFRMLYGAGRLVQDFYTFANDAPDAEGLSLHFGAEANDNHTAYRGGMSAWCGNCHGDFHNNNTKLIHPSGETLGGTIAGIYNLYNGTDDILGGGSGTASPAWTAAAGSRASASTPPVTSSATSRWARSPTAWPASCGGTAVRRIENR